MDSAKLIQSTEAPESNRKAKESNGKAEAGSGDAIAQTDGAAAQTNDAAAPMAIDSSPQSATSGPTVGPEVTARLGLALAFVKRVLGNGDGALMRPQILRFLPPLLLLQDLKLPELQRLGLISRTALAMVKQLPMGSTQASAQAAELLSQAATAHLWTGRASAISWAQVFWFRHVFLLLPEDSARLQDVIERMLGDSKLEVANWASATLVGFLKAASPSDAEAARQRYLAAAASHRTRAKRRRPAAAAASATSEGGEGKAAVMGRHAAVLALRAVAACAPYDAPRWLPEILVALAAASSDAAPTGKAARTALADFRRTHEPAALAETRCLLGAEGWEAITEIEGGREGGFA